jgi:dihydroorotase-like cyclic amidohydrolase
MLDLLIRNGEVVDPVDGVYHADVGILDGKIVSLLEPGTEADADQEIDATGKHVFPGCIDPHTHMGYKRSFADDVRSESGSAAIGGVTTFMSFHRHYQSAEPKPYDDFPELVDTINRESHIDMGLHFGILTEDQVNELEKYINLGVSSFKFYMAYRGADGKTVGMINECDDGILFEGFEKIARHSHAVACVHCENTEIIGRRVRQVKEEGLDGLAAWNAARPSFAEAEHVRRAAYFAELTGCKLYFVHIGAKAGLEEAVLHRERYDRLTIETCPHYLTLTEDSDIGNLAKINPPVRKQDDQDRIWEGLINGEISTVGTDHCCVCRAEKAGSIWDAAAGFPGMATMLPVVLTEGVHKRGMSLQRAAQITSYNSAVAFNMAPRKGTLHVGSDADVAVVDLKLEKVVDPALLGSASDFSLQEGNTLTGWPVLTVLRGKIIVRDGELLGEPGDGEFVRR